MPPLGGPPASVLQYTTHTNWSWPTFVDTTNGFILTLLLYLRIWYFHNYYHVDTLVENRSCGRVVNANCQGKSRILKDKKVYSLKYRNHDTDLLNLLNHLKRDFGSFTQLPLHSISISTTNFVGQNGIPCIQLGIARLKTCFVYFRVQVRHWAIAMLQIRLCLLIG